MVGGVSDGMGNIVFQQKTIIVGGVLTGFILVRFFSHLASRGVYSNSTTPFLPHAGVEFLSRGVLLHGVE